MDRLLVMLLIAFFASNADAAAKTLDEVASDVYVAEGKAAAEIAGRAEQCLKSASGNVADKVDPIRDGDSVFAIVITGFSHMLLESKVRSRMTVFAKEGRFKVVHTDIEQPDELRGGMMPVYMHAGGGAKQATAALTKRSAAVADCITKPSVAPGGDNW